MVVCDMVALAGFEPATGDYESLALTTELKGREQNNNGA